MGGSYPSDFELNGSSFASDRHDQFLDHLVMGRVVYVREEIVTGSEFGAKTEVEVSLRKRYVGTEPIRPDLRDRLG